MSSGKPLSKRQREIVELVAQGLTDKEVALKLGLAEGTLRTYWDRLRRRYDARSRSEVIAKAIARPEDEAIGKHILYKLPLFVWTATPDGYVDFCNEWFETEAGLKPAESLGVGCKALMPDDELVESRARWRNAQETGQGYEALVHFRCGKSAEMRLHKIKLTPLRGSDGAIHRWLGYGRELAENADEQLLRFLKAFLL